MQKRGEEILEKADWVLIGPGGMIPTGLAATVWGIMAVCIVATLLMTANLRVRDPGKPQLAAEAIVCGLTRFGRGVRQKVAHSWKRVATVVGIIAAVIVVTVGANMLNPQTPNMEGFKESLTEALTNETVFTIPVLGGIPIGSSVVVTWIIMAFWMILTLILTRNLKVENPGKVQAALEAAVGFLNGFVKQSIGRHWRSFAPYLGTVALYIGSANIIGIFGLTSPTKDVSVTASLAVMSMLLIYGAQFRFRGLRGGIKRFAEPMWLLTPINLMEVAVRPLALCMRLFGNILGAFIIMEMIKYLVPAVIPAAFCVYFDLFDGIIQTIVFVFLTALFTGEGIQEEE